MSIHTVAAFGVELSGDLLLALISGVALLGAIALGLAWTRMNPRGDAAAMPKKPRSATTRPASVSQRHDGAGGRFDGNGRVAAVATLTSKGGGGEEFSLGPEPNTIGSSISACTIVLVGDGIAPEHARIWFRQGKFLLHHVGGLSRKTYVSGHEADWVVLESGDEVAIGPHRLVFAERVSAAAPVAIEEPEDVAVNADDLALMEAAVRELWAEATPASETAVGQRSGTGKYKVHRRKDELAARVGGQWVKRGRTVVLER
jgi:hypothetical protein